RHEECGVIKACLARIVGLGAWVVLKMNECHAASAKHGAVFVAIEHGEPEHVAVEAAHSIEVAYLEPDRADMDRGAVREGRGGRRVRGVHGKVYRDFRPLAQ